MDLNTTTILKNPDLNDIKTKNRILKYLYQRVTAVTKIIPVTKTSELDDIRSSDYIICPRFSGTRSWIVFFKDKSNYYAVNFPQHSEHKQQDTRIFPIELDASSDIYAGTIMEGIYYRTDDLRYLVIDDVYQLAGQNQLLKSKDDRLRFIASWVTTDAKKFIMKNNFRLCVSQFYSISSPDIIELYEKIRSDGKIQEIIFYPKIFGKKIYQYTILESDLVADIINISKLKMCKTDKPDVYNLYYVDSDKKIGIAYIPDMATTKKCKQWFKDNKTNALIVNCKLNTEQHRWVPIDLVGTD